ncbi:hypothetical protein GGR56DRAFT_553570 [Xylariaceae sp. FL0804]|nr:hypothetical protein GGR56DRAFT_553570 [Xylariaceae sp. FL0804]
MNIPRRSNRDTTGMDLEATATSPIANHGPGAQTLHSGQGSQSINAGSGQLYNIKNLIQFSSPERVNDLLSAAAEGQLPLVNNESQPPTDLLGWLAPLSKTNHLGRHRHLASHRVGGTGEWLFESDEFREWRAGKSRFLWLDGILGAGKSTLASIVVDRLSSGINGTGMPACCVYVYFHEDDEFEPSLQSIYANILSQILRCKPSNSSTSRQLQDIYRVSKTHRISPGHEEYTALLDAEAESFSEIFLIVDALDMCDCSTDHMIREKLVKGIRQLTRTWKVLFTARSGTIPTGIKLESDLATRVDAHDSDIRLYVESCIKDSATMSRLVQERVATDPSFQNFVSQTITQKAKGMFLLAKLHMDSLAAQHTLGHFRDILTRLPEDRTKTFDAALQRIDKQEEFPRRVAQHVLAWLTSSAKPVSVDEVRHAFAVDLKAGSFNPEFIILDETLLTAVCAGLVVIEPSQRTLQPVHDSVLAHIRDSTIVSGKAHAEMALQCLTYLMLDKLDRSPQSKEYIQKCLSEYPLLSYAADYWYYHVRQAKQDGVLEGLVLEFLENDRSVTNSFLFKRGKFPTNITGLHACAYFGREEWAEELLVAGGGANAAAADGQTPLHWAVNQGHEGSAADQEWRKTRPVEQA